MTHRITAAQLRRFLACPQRPACDAMQGTEDDVAWRARELATRHALVARAPLVVDACLSTPRLAAGPCRLRREGAGYAALEPVQEAGGFIGGGVALALYVDVLEQMGLSAGRHGYLYTAQGQEQYVDLGAPLAPGDGGLWERYLLARMALDEALLMQRP